MTTTRPRRTVTHKSRPPAPTPKPTSESERFVELPLGDVAVELREQTVIAHAFFDEIQKQFLSTHPEGAPDRLDSLIEMAVEAAFRARLLARELHQRLSATKTTE